MRSILLTAILCLFAACSDPSIGHNAHDASTDKVDAGSAETVDDEDLREPSASNLERSPQALPRPSSKLSADLRPPR